ncbi:hemolysin XhlA family protein [Clostridioides sp. ES-S-0048-02]|uniref:hemolysin XhlA family protein n=1 Tax=Clostridioides sp. ES-S-0048-02 TaxID=2770777 RepID=UPI001D10A57E|nr:hemolysin XhlA family protein [Clostridioides sp. ES-S-0048-02]
MNEELVKEKINTLETRVKEHGKQIDRIEIEQAKFAIQIQNLCSDIKNLTGVLKWLVGVIITTLVGFFIFAIQRGIF